MLEREQINSQTYILGYHTQEWRNNNILSNPIICQRDDAWLGEGFYFWANLDFAHYWGLDSKRRNTGYYSIYKALIEEENLLNTSFNEIHNDLFTTSIELALQHLSQTIANIELVQIHRFLAENVWPRMGVTGIIYDDLPKNSSRNSRTYSHVPPLYYKKRVQIVLFNLAILHSFEVLLDKCNNNND